MSDEVTYIVRVRVKGEDHDGWHNGHGLADDVAGAGSVDRFDRSRCGASSAILETRPPFPLIRWKFKLEQAVHSYAVVGLARFPAMAAALLRAAS